MPAKTAIAPSHRIVSRIAALSLRCISAFISLRETSV
jgi:hypothetical protein